MQQVCPLMSIATLEAPKPGALLVGGKPPEPQFVQCVGKACAFFCPLHDEKGQLVGGGCAVALIPQALISLQQTIVEATTVPESNGGNPDTH